MITADLEALVEPLERFEGIRRRVLRLGPRLCDLSYANPYAGAQEEAVAVMKNVLENQHLLDLQYTPFGGQTLIRRAAADALRSSHGVEFAFDDVVLTPGAMAALQVALRTAGRAGDEVVIPVPCWLDYPLYARAIGLEPVTVPLAAGTFDLDVPAITEAITERTCAVLLSHPANPTGRNYSSAGLAELSRALWAAEDRLGGQITLIADETHRDFTLSGDYCSAAGVWDRTILIYSFGKYHFMQGQRLGYAAVCPSHPERKETSTEMVRWTRITGLATPTSLMQRVLPGLLQLRHPLDWLITWRRRVVDALSAVGYGVVVPQATMFVYVQTPTGYDDFDFVSELAARGVLMLPAPVFHHLGYFRLSLTGSEQMLEQALSILTRWAPA